MAKGFVGGVIVTLLVLVLIGYVGITQGVLIPANADARPSQMEAWAARRSLHATLRREAPHVPNPVALSDANLLAGLKLYGTNCSVCHGVADGAASTIAVGLYQKAPQLGKDGVEDDPDGITFWKVKHGIRLTGMPAFAQTLSDQQIWQVALFLKHMDSLPPVPQKAWKALKNPGELAPRSTMPRGVE